jgi:protein ImuB
MKSRILSLWLPNLATDRLRRRAAREPGGTGPPPERPLATFTETEGALRLAAVDPLAGAAGLSPGMALADARALVPALEVRPADPAAEARLLEEIRRFAERWTPHVAIDRSHPAAAGGALWLDITGCAHLFGGEAELRQAVLSRLERQGFRAEAAIADHPGTAWAIARYGAAERMIASPGGAREALAALPVAALRLESTTIETLERLGLARIDSLYPLPRQALAARFGDELGQRLDQALGRVAEPISPEPPRPAHRAQLALAEPVTHPPGVQALVRRLLDELCAGLAQSCLGTRRLTLAFCRVDNTVARIGVGTSQPSRHARELFRLFEEKLETVDPGFGIERAILDAVQVEPLLPAPIAWRGMGAGDLDEARDLAPMVDRLANRLGAAAVVRLDAQASHLPERAQRQAPLLEAGRPVPFRHHARTGAGSVRPLRLLPRPEPIEAMAPLPDAPPVLFRWRRELHRVKRVSGPERLAPEWWRAPASEPATLTRDYFAVENAAGERFWLFREGLYDTSIVAMPRWYLHGFFA